MILENSLFFRDAPPTKAPTTFCKDSISLAFFLFTEPPYKIDTFFEKSHLDFKIDLIDEGRKFKSKIEKYLSNNYSQYQMINTDFISAKKNIRIKNFIKQIINKNKLTNIEISKKNLNKFLNYLNKQSKYPKIKKKEIKPKYIVQIKTGSPLFKVFINSKKKAPLIFQRFFDNAFRDFFKIKGVPISYQFISSNNPYSD